MAGLANFLQSLNLNIDPKILLYIFLGLACLSLISLCSILTAGGKRPEPDKDLTKKSTHNLDEEVKLPAEKTQVEEIITPKNLEINLDSKNKEMEEAIIPNEEKSEQPIVEPLTPINEEIELPELPISFDSGRAKPSYLTPKEVEPEKEPEVTTIPEDIPARVTVELPEEITSVEVPPKPAPMPIFSSVYLERKEDEVAPEEIEHSEIIEAPVIPEPLPKPIIKPTIKPIEAIVEEEIEPLKEPEIFPDIIDEIQAHRHGDKANLSFSLSRAMPGKVLPNFAEEKTSIEEPAPKEVILTPEVLKARLAKLSESSEMLNNEKNVSVAPATNNDELDQILKQIGLDNLDASPELADEEKIILGR